MINIGAVTAFLEKLAPLKYQESYDNSGLLVGHPETIVNGILVCLDSTDAVIDEAIELGCNMVIAHHPIIFKGLKKLTGQNYIEKAVIKAIKNGICIYAIHTNLDNVYQNGVNGKIAEKIGLQSTKILNPFPGVSQEQQSIGAGIVGTLPEAISEMEFLHHLKLSMNAGCIKYTRLLNRPVKKVAVCGGSGSFLLNKAIAEGVDVFVSADFKYHEFFDANDIILITDIGHYESEQFTIELLSDILSKKFSTFAVRSTKTITNPVAYL